MLKIPIRWPVALAVPAVLVPAVLVLAACGSGTAGTQPSASPSAPAHSPSAHSPAAHSPSGGAAAPSVAVPQWAGSVVYTDAQGYSWKLTWEFTPSAASDAPSFTANDRPDQATLKIPVSGRLELTNMTDRNASPPADVDIFALYPARSPFCKYLFNSFTPAPPLARFNGTPHPACPIQLMSAGSFYGNATLAQGASFSPKLAWADYTESGPVPYNVFLVPAAREKALITDVDTVKPLTLIIGVGDAGSNSKQCSFPSLNGGNAYLVDSTLGADLTCLPGQAGMPG